MPSLDSLEELMHGELKDIYDAEKQLTKALPKLARKASAMELRDAFTAHLRETEQHVERLEQIFDQLGLPARGKKCEGMQHLIAEGNAMISEAEDDAARDAVMIAAAQKVEHYEIATYGTIRTWATLLGKRDIAAMLEDTLEEEKAADQKLTGIAESFVNEAAAEEGQDREEETRPRGTSRSARSDVSRTSRSAAADRGRSRSHQRSR
jgi:ferritin-like metal-binding protein YciE